MFLQMNSHRNRSTENVISEIRRLNRMVQQLQYKNKVLEISQDEDPESPREWDNTGTMVCKHTQYTLGDVQTLLTSYDEYLKSKGLAPEDIAVMLPLYLLDHSGISMSCGERVYPYDDPWDSSAVGFIYVTKEKIRKEWNVKKISKVIIGHVTEMLEAEVATYDQYLRGDVYTFVLYTKHTCSLNEIHLEVIDSCSGFYGDHEKSGLTDNIENFAKFEATQ